MGAARGAAARVEWVVLVEGRVVAMAAVASVVTRVAVGTEEEAWAVAARVEGAPAAGVRVVVARAGEKEGARAVAEMVAGKAAEAKAAAAMVVVLATAEKAAEGMVVVAVMVVVVRS